MTVLLTGATGFVGSFLASRLPDPPRCLVRGQDPQARLGTTGIAVPGDVARPLDHVDMRDVTHLVHCAADVAFTRPLDEARAINVAGARHVAALAARAPRLERLVHVSTAYVAGTHAGTFTEGDSDVGQRHRNSYEQSKLEAEAVMRAAGATIVRPSIVVGDSVTGWTSSFNVLYPPLRALARGLVDAIPADPEALVDVVPVDHVADVILAAMRTDGTLHAVAGDAAPTARELAQMAARALDVPVPGFTTEGLPPGGLEVYAPYFTVRTRFTADRTRALGLAPPPLADYLPRILAFAQRARWGKAVPALAA